MEEKKNFNKCMNDVIIKKLANVLDMRMVMAATPKRAQATKMDRPAGVFGE